MHTAFNFGIRPSQFTLQRVNASQQIPWTFPSPLADMHPDLTVAVL
jgi:hypothetical protein